MSPASVFVFWLAGNPFPGAWNSGNSRLSGTHLTAINRSVLINLLIIDAIMFCQAAAKQPILLAPWVTSKHQSRKLGHFALAIREIVEPLHFCGPAGNQAYRVPAQFIKDP